MASWKFDRAYFFNKVRNSVFAGRLTASQVRGMDAILDALEEFNVTNPLWVGAVFATARVEVGAGMVPVREGFAKTDGAARAAVAKLYREGKISRNYALPNAETGESYYGRGYPQTTHYENYLKTGQALGQGDLFVRHPDLLLEPKWAARGMVVMMLKGGYRTGRSLSAMLGSFPHVPTYAEVFAARDIINGDKNYTRDGRKIGDWFADYAFKFADAVKIVREAGEPVPVPEVKPDVPAVPVDKPATTAYLTFWERVKAFFAFLFS